MPYLSTKQRLIVCLDGTWNNRDDTTNVFHHLTLAFEGDVAGPNGTTITQRRFYHPGVGTGVLDKVSGGAFGIGVEDNVRAGYNWLVENFNQAQDGSDADEIYIFGFSRGAYTARSLVGFISRCGLLRRGAPLTVKQLWEDYCILGREREERRSFWDRVFGDDPTRIRQITQLISDPWDIPRDAEPPFPGAVAGQKRDDLTESERLLVRWSRRVRITYLGVYDTVGAIGIDALAIPGLKSKLALHNNMRPTTLVQRCRHALALYEHRTSFSHTPMLEYIGHEGLASKWVQNHAMWRRKIEQRWFVGSHANIGGGYDDNELAQLPLRWIMDGAEQQGLKCEPKTITPPSPHVRPRDSYAEFLAPIAAWLLRVKRYYRPIDPPPGVRASAAAKKSGRTRPSFSLAPINEEIDSSVFAFVAHTGEAPPNLVDYAKRRSASAAPGPFPPHPNSIPPADALATVLKNRQSDRWLGEKTWPYAWLILWATLVAAGLAAAHQIVFARPGFLPPVIFLAIVAAVFAAVDWCESRLNFSVAEGIGGPAFRACRDAVYWLRALGVVLFFLGAIATLIHLAGMGWKAGTFATARDSWIETIATWWRVPALAGVSVAVAAVLSRGTWSRVGIGLAAILGSTAIAAIATAVLVFGAAFLARVAGSPFPPSLLALGDPPNQASLAGMLLLLQAGVLYFLNTWQWAGEPMARANLGSIITLQRRWTPTSIKACLDDWTQRLECRWSLPDSTPHHDAAVAMRRIVGETLWRDLIGFVPVYACVLGVGSWFAAWLAAERFGWDWPLRGGWSRLPPWAWPVAAAAIADIIEDICQLGFLARHSAGKMASGFLSPFAAVFTWIKLLGFTVASLLTLWALVHGSWVVARVVQMAGWRGTLAVLISSVGAGLAIALVIGVVFYRETAQRKAVRGEVRLKRESATNL